MTLQNVTTISFDKKLEKRLTDYAKHHSISRSAAIRLACTDFLDRMETN